MEGIQVLIQSLYHRYLAANPAGIQVVRTNDTILRHPRASFIRSVSSKSRDGQSRCQGPRYWAYEGPLIRAFNFGPKLSGPAASLDLRVTSVSKPPMSVGCSERQHPRTRRDEVAHVQKLLQKLLPTVRNCTHTCGEPAGSLRPLHNTYGRYLYVIVRHGDQKNTWGVHLLHRCRVLPMAHHQARMDA